MIGTGKNDPKTKPMTPEEEEKLWRRWKRTQDTKVRDRFILSMTGLAVQEVGKCSSFITASVPREDLLQAAMAGVAYAFTKFDLTRGNRFNTYALWWLRAYLWEAAREQRCVISGVAFNGKEKDAVKDKKRAVRVGYLGEGDGFSGHDTETPDTFMKNFVNGNLEDLENLLSEGMQEDELEREADVIRLREGMRNARLTAREREVLTRRYLNWKGDKQLGLKEVGEKMGVSRERARQIEASALRKVRRVIQTYSVQEENALLEIEAEEEGKRYG